VAGVDYRDWNATDVPWPIYKLGLVLFRWFFWFQNLILPATMTIANVTFSGFCLSEIIRTLASLDVAERLSHGPKTAEELADEIGVLSPSCEIVSTSFFFLFH
jgi:hypothetical protein